MPSTRSRGKKSGAYRVLIPTKLAIEGVRILEHTPGILVDFRPGLKGADFRKALAESDAVIIRSDSDIDAKTITAAGRLRLIGRAGVGVENVDVHAASARGIVVLNTPSANSIAVAELAMALMLALTRKIIPADISVKAGRWEKSALAGHELGGKTLGLVGLGRIGREVAQRATAFAMRVVAFDPYVTKAAAEAMGVTLLKLPQLLSQADYISLHLPLTDKTRNLISAAQLRRMKPGAFLVNASRGGIVDENALAKALRNGRLGGCALDVFTTEPPQDLWFAGMDNVIVTPHLGASTAESQTKVAVEIAEAVRRALLEGVYVNAVNLPLGDPSDLPRLLPYVHLAERLGVLLRALEEGPCGSLTLELGAQVHPEARLIQAAVLKGFLSAETDVPITLVNASEVAASRGVRVAIVDRTTQADQAHALQIEGVFGRRRRLVAGIVAGGISPRVHRIDEFPIDVAPEGRALIFTNQDKPGVIGAAGAVLGKARINIASWLLGRRHRGGTALGFVVVDDPVPDGVLRELSALPHMGHVTQVNWGTGNE
jgi:D-3-phosphoglycerate dehydrogenase